MSASILRALAIIALLIKFSENTVDIQYKQASRCGKAVQRTGPPAMNAQLRYLINFNTEEVKAGISFGMWVYMFLSRSGSTIMGLYSSNKSVALIYTFADVLQGKFGMKTQTTGLIIPDEWVYLAGSVYYSSGEYHFDIYFNDEKMLTMTADKQLSDIFETDPPTFFVVGESYKGLDLFGMMDTLTVTTTIISAAGNSITKMMNNDPSLTDVLFIDTYDQGVYGALSPSNPTRVIKAQFEALANTGDYFFSIPSTLPSEHCKNSLSTSIYVVSTTAGKDRYWYKFSNLEIESGPITLTYDDSEVQVYLYNEATKESDSVTSATTTISQGSYLSFVRETADVYTIDVSSGGDLVSIVVEPNKPPEAASFTVSLSPYTGTNIISLGYRYNDYSLEYGYRKRYKTVKRNGMDFKIRIKKIPEFIEMHTLENKLLEIITSEDLDDKKLYSSSNYGVNITSTDHCQAELMEIHYELVDEVGYSSPGIVSVASSNAYSSSLSQEVILHRGKSSPKFKLMTINPNVKSESSIIIKAPTHGKLFVENADGTERELERTEDIRTHIAWVEKAFASSSRNPADCGDMLGCGSTQDFFTIKRSTPFAEDQMEGPPDTNGQWGPSPLSWIPDQTELEPWVIVKFTKTLAPTSVRIYQNWLPSPIRRISRLRIGGDIDNEEDWTTLWEGSVRSELTFDDNFIDSIYVFNPPLSLDVSPTEMQYAKIEFDNLKDRDVAIAIDAIALLGVSLTNTDFVFDTNIYYEPDVQFQGEDELSYIDNIGFEDQDRWIIETAPEKTVKFIVNPFNEKLDLENKTMAFVQTSPSDTLKIELKVPTEAGQLFAFCFPKLPKGKLITSTGYVLQNDNECVLASSFEYAPDCESEERSCSFEYFAKMADMFESSHSTYEVSFVCATKSVAKDNSASVVFIPVFAAIVALFSGVTLSLLQAK